MALSLSSNLWVPVGSVVTASKPGDVDTVKKHPLGTVRKFRNVDYGEGEFIYLAGATSTAAGDAVSYNTASYTTTRAAAGAGIPWAIAFAMAVVDSSSKYGWYQIKGVTVANKTKTVSFAAGIALGISTAALVIHSSSLKELLGAWTAVICSDGTTTANAHKALLVIDYPRLQGRIT